MVFAIHQHESATSVYVSPVPNPPPTSLSFPVTFSSNAFLGKVAALWQGEHRGIKEGTLLLDSPPHPRLPSPLLSTRLRGPVFALPGPWVGMNRAQSPWEVKTGEGPTPALFALSRVCHMFA